MKKVLGAIVAGSILLSTSFANFTDVDSTHWASPAIYKMQEAGILSGYSDGTFRPNKNITLAEFATIFTKIFEISPDNESNYFVDVNTNHWAKSYLEAVRTYINPYYDSIGEAMGVTDYSYLEGLTGDMEITREAFIYAVSRIYGYNPLVYKENEEKELFADYEEILFPKETVLAYKNKVISGEKIDDKVYIRPNRKITRAEASSIFNNLLKYEAKRVTNKGEEYELKASYSKVIKSLKENGIKEAKNFTYDTQDILKNDKFILDSDIELALNELILTTVSDYEYEITGVDFINYNKGYIRVKSNSYDILEEINEVIKNNELKDKDVIVKNIKEMRENILDKKTKKNEREDIVKFIKYDGEWKIILE